MAEVSFGEWLRRQRKAAGLTQEQLARQISYSTSALKKIEAEERRPSAQIAEKLAVIFDIPQHERTAFKRFARGDWRAAPMGVENAPWLFPQNQEHKDQSKPTVRLFTFLFTDIEDSTKLSQQYPDAMPGLLARHHEILNQAIQSYNGHVFEVAGDSFAAAFDSPSLALNAALEAQRYLHKEPWSPVVIKVRMGIHTGEAQLNKTSVQNPYSGYTTLALTQRIMSAGHGGQILLSNATEVFLRGELPKQVDLRDMGKYKFKDVFQPIRVFQVSAADLQNEFPALRALKVLTNNLPVQLTSFIGREHELVEVQQLLSNTRLLTLTGPGGTGKTRLCSQVAQDLLLSFVDGVWWVELAPLADPGFMISAIASVFELREMPKIPIMDIVTDYLRAKQLLLILDNCEHLIEACAKLSDHLLHACPQLKIIATSREALRIAGEIVYRVPSLSLPNQAQVTQDAVLGFESVQLFVERASAANPKFHLTHANASSVAQICRRLDGIPLALELAAARVAVFSPEEIASRLNDRFKLLTGGSRAALERHQTLEALIDWSYELLSNDERRLFRHLSVFAGGWTFEAAEAVCPDLDVLNILTQLVDKSLVMADMVGADAPERSTRYHLLDTIRQYGSEKSLEAGESGQTRTQHMNFFLKFAEAAEPQLSGPQELEWLSRLEMEYDNLRAALEWAMQNDSIIALRLGTALQPFWNRHGHVAEGHRLLSEAVARAKALPPAQGNAARQRIAIFARALNAIGLLRFGKGDYLGAVQVFEESVDLSRQIGEKRSLLQALSYLVNANLYLGFGERGYPLAEEALRLARSVGDKFLLGMALINMAGTVALEHGDPKTALPYGGEGLQLLKEHGSLSAIAYALLGMGRIAARQGNYAEARSRFEDCLPLFATLKDKHRTIMVRSEVAHLERWQGHIAQAKPLYQETILQWQDLGHRAAIAHELECLAMIAKAQEEEQRAARLFGAAEALRESINTPMTPFERVEYDREVDDLRANMDEKNLARFWGKGRAMTMQQAIEYALENTG